MSEQQFKNGDRIRFKNKEELNILLGTDAAGYPKTNVRFNSQGLMDHYFNATGTIKSISDYFIEVDFDNKIEGKDYTFTVSTDMVEPIGNIPKNTATLTQYRTFLKNVKNPTYLQIWKAASALQKKLTLPYNFPFYIVQQLSIKTTEEIRNLIEYTEHLGSICPTNYFKEFTYKETVRPVEILVHHIVKNNVMETTPIYKLAQTLVKVKANEKLQIELSNTPYTTLKRYKLPTKQGIKEVWNNLNFEEKYLVGPFGSSTEDALMFYIHKNIVNYLNKNNKEYLTEKDIITIGEYDEA